MQTVASSVRRESQRGGGASRVTVLIEPSEPRGRFDAPGLELLLRTTLRQRCRSRALASRFGSRLTRAGEGRARVRLSHKSGHAPIERRNTLERLVALARKVGASATFSDPVVRFPSDTCR